MVLAWTRDDLWHGQARGWRTHTQTHRQINEGNDNTRRPKLASGNKMMQSYHYKETWCLHWNVAQMSRLQPHSLIQTRMNGSCLKIKEPGKDLKEIKLDFKRCLLFPLGCFLGSPYHWQYLPLDKNSIANQLKGSGDHFTKDFSKQIQIWQWMCFAFAQIMIYI